MFDRIETTYNAIDEMAKAHGKKRPPQFGGGKWNKHEELKLYIHQVGPRYSPLQWKMILSYAKTKGFKIPKMIDVEKETRSWM